jgi:hypothetical protein
MMDGLRLIPFATIVSTELGIVDATAFAEASVSKAAKTHPPLPVIIEGAEASRSSSARFTAG